MSSTRGEFQHLFWGVYAPIAGTAVLVVFVTVVVLVVRFRARPVTSSTSSNRIVELVAVCVLGAFVVLLLSQTYEAEGNDDALHRAALVVDVVAFQWGWTFSYPGTHVATSSGPDRPPTLVLPAGETIEIRLRSRDVIHSLWVPEQRFKRLAFPDRETRFDLRFDRTGRFAGRCATFCGLRHLNMTFVVDVRTRAAFRTWLGTQESAT